MQLKNLVNELKRAKMLPLEERMEEYFRTLEDVKDRFPEFAIAVDRHLELVMSGLFVSPTETSDWDVFESVFSKIPGLYEAYMFIMEHEWNMFKK